MTPDDKARVVNTWLSGDTLTNVAQFHSLNKLTVERLLREAFTGLLQQLQASESKSTPPRTPEGTTA